MAKRPGARRGIRLGQGILFRPVSSIHKIFLKTR
jgi:hypothetical protein